MFVGAIQFELRLPQCHSLKEKRAVIRPIVDGARHRYRVSSAEVAKHDAWQQAVVGMATVSASAGHATEVLDEVERFVWSFPEVEVVNVERMWVDGE